MSKSDENTNGWIALLDKPEDIMRKFKRAVTDSDGGVHYAEGKDGVNNLMGIYSCVTEKLRTNRNGILKAKATETLRRQ